MVACVAAKDTTQVFRCRKRLAIAAVRALSDAVKHQETEVYYGRASRVNELKDEER